MQNNIMGYVTVENLPRPTTKRKWSSSATKATPSCHDWKREVGHNKFTSALSQIKGHQHRDLNLTIPKTVWSEFEVIMATTLCQYNYETRIAVLTRSTLTQGIYNKRCFIGYVLQFSLPFLNLENTSTATSTSWIASQGLASPQTSFGVRLSRIHFSQNEPQRTSAGRLPRDVKHASVGSFMNQHRSQKCLIVWSPYLDRNQIRHRLRKFLKQDSHAIHDPLLERVEFQWNFDFL